MTYFLKELDSTPVIKHISVSIVKHMNIHTKKDKDYKSHASAQ